MKYLLLNIALALARAALTGVDDLAQGLDDVLAGDAHAPEILDPVLSCPRFIRPRFICPRW